jgi:hypothetical protein
MALSDAIVTNGSTLQVGDGATPTEAFAAIAEIVTMEPPAGEASEVEVTHLTSPAKEFRAGLADYGSGTATLNLIPGDSSQEQLEDDAADGTVRNYRIMFPDGTNGRAFAAFISSFKLDSIGADAPLRATATFRATGPVTRVPAV